MFCQQCGAELKEGEKFCPKCGRPMELTDQKSTQNLQEPIAATEGSATQTNITTKKKKPMVIFIAVAVVFVVIIAALAVLGSESGDKSSYADGLVEANNEFGLSTTMTLEEFVEHYNESLASHGLDDSLFWIDLEYGQVLNSVPGITEYRFIFSGATLTQLKQHIFIAVDNETGYVLSAIFKYTNSGYDSATSDQRSVVSNRTIAVFDAFCKGDSNKLSEIIEIMKSLQDSGYVYWKDGTLYIQSGDADGFTNVGFQTMTQEAYEERYQQ